MSGAADSGSDLLDRRLPRATLVTMLSLASGVTDAISFLYLGGVFTSVITGTLVVLGLSVANGSGSTVVRAGIAFAAYALGVLDARGVAALRPSCAGRDSQRLRAAIKCLTSETALLVAMWGSWLVVYPDPAGLGQIQTTTGTRRLGDGNAGRRHAQPRASRPGHHLSDRPRQRWSAASVAVAGALARLRTCLVWPA